jgi:hypothetical protein
MRKKRWTRRERKEASDVLLLKPPPLPLHPSEMLLIWIPTKKPSRMKQRELRMVIVGALDLRIILLGMSSSHQFQSMILQVGEIY